MIRPARSGSHFSQLAGRSKLSAKFVLAMLMSHYHSALPSHQPCSKRP